MIIFKRLQQLIFVRMFTDYALLVSEYSYICVQWEWTMHLWHCYTWSLQFTLTCWLKHEWYTMHLFQNSWIELDNLVLGSHGNWRGNLVISNLPWSMSFRNSTKIARKGIINQACYRNNYLSLIGVKQFDRWRMKLSRLFFLQLSNGYNVCYQCCWGQNYWNCHGS